MELATHNISFMFASVSIIPLLCDIIIKSYYVLTKSIPKSITKASLIVTIVTSSH